MRCPRISFVVFDLPPVKTQQVANLLQICEEGLLLLSKGVGGHGLEIQNEQDFGFRGASLSLVSRGLQKPEAGQPDRAKFSKAWRTRVRGQGQRVRAALRSPPK